MGAVAQELAVGGAGWAVARQGGTVLIWVAVVTMLGGVMMALLQQNAKRMLAYHSISQMGYILLGIGVAGYLGEAGAVGFAGAWLHLVNHALFKGCLFLAVGAVLLRTGEVNMYRLGGMWREMPFTAVACLIAAAGISGVPGLNGYASKTLLHHAVVEAAGMAGAGVGVGAAAGAMAGAMALGAGAAVGLSAVGAGAGNAMLWVERLFVLTGVGTAASFVKLYSLIFLGRPRGVADRPREVSPALRRPEPTGPEEMPLKLGMAMLSLAIVAIGLMPGRALVGLVGPAASGFGFGRAALEHALRTQVFAPGDLLSVTTTILMGAALFWGGYRTGLFHVHGPEWLSIEWLAVRGATAIGRAWVQLSDAWARAVIRVERRLKLGLRRAGRALPMLDYLPGRTETQREFSLLNLDFDFYLVLAVIALVLMLLGLWQMAA
jgi:formate hydrogenlyase subunit 3/multisubunit Na+/H+ antiporter MnhD subunit